MDWMLLLTINNEIYSSMALGDLFSASTVRTRPKATTGDAVAAVAAFTLPRGASPHSRIVFHILHWSACARSLQSIANTNSSKLLLLAPLCCGARRVQCDERKPPANMKSTK